MITRADDLDDDGPSVSRVEFWRRAAAFGFSAWAIVIPLAAAAVINSLSKFTEKFENYVVTMERRITLLEERQARVLQTLTEHAAEMRALAKEHDIDIGAVRDRINNGKPR